MKLKKQNGLYVPNRNLENIVIPRRTFLRGAIAGVGSLALSNIFCSDNGKNGNKTGTGTSGTGTDTDTGTSNTNTNTNTGQPPVNYPVSGKITGISLDLSEFNLEATIQLKQDDVVKYSQTCLSDGTYVIQVPEAEQGEYQMVISYPDFNTHIKGILTINQEKHQQSKLQNIDDILFPNDTNFNTEFNKSCREEYPYTQRWETPPQTIYIITKNIADNSDIPAQAIDVMIDFFTNYVPRFTNNFINQDNLNIEFAETFTYGPNKINADWDNSFGPSIFGAHNEDNGNYDDSAKELKYARMTIRGPPPFAGQHKIDIAILHEGSQIWGARCDNTSTGVLNPNNLTLTDYENICLLIGRFLYTRPSGNTSPDTNLDHMIN